MMYCEYCDKMIDEDTNVEHIEECQQEFLQRVEDNANNYYCQEGMN